MPMIFPPTRGERRWRAAGYVLVAAVGFYAFYGPTTISERLGWLIDLWAVFMLTALPAAIAVLRQRWRVEAVLLPLFGSALLVSVVNAFFRIADGIVADEMSLIPRALTASALLCMLVIRGLQLHRILKAEPWITTG